MRVRALGFGTLKAGKSFYNTDVDIEMVKEERVLDLNVVTLQLTFDNRAYVDSLTTERDDQTHLTLKSAVFLDIFPFCIVFNSNMVGMPTHWTHSSAVVSLADRQRPISSQENVCRSIGTERSKSSTWKLALRCIDLEWTERIPVGLVPRIVELIKRLVWNTWSLGNLPLGNLPYVALTLNRPNEFQLVWSHAWYN